MSRRLSLVVQEPNSTLELTPGVQQQDVVMGTPDLLHLRVSEESFELCNVICLFHAFPQNNFLQEMNRKKIAGL